MLETEEIYMAPARARECCLDQRQKKAVLRKGMRMVKEQNPRAGEGLRVGELLCDNRTALAGHRISILMFTDAFPLTFKLD